MARRPSVPMLEVNDLVVCYGATPAVCGASLSLERGAMAALVGPSGCGKTSLLRAIAGFERPTSGSVRLAGTAVVDSRCWIRPERRQVGMVFQQGALFPHLDVSGNVGFGLRGSHARKARVAEVLELVGLTNFARRYPDELSGGQQQRAALARALAPAPRIILLDEPFASLDAETRLRTREEVCAILRRAGTTTLLVTHDQEEALSFADRVAVMDGGWILQVGSPEEIYHHPSSPRVARLVGDVQFVDCTIEGGLLRSALGPIACGAPAGPGRMMVRPEDITMDRCEGGPGVAGHLLSRRFLGHDAVNEVGLTDGKRLLVRDLAGRGDLPIGTRVRLALRTRSYPVFPADDDGSAPIGDARPLASVATDTPASDRADHQGLPARTPAPAHTAPVQMDTAQPAIDPA